MDTLQIEKSFSIHILRSKAAFQGGQPGEGDGWEGEISVQSQGKKLLILILGATTELFQYNKENQMWPAPKM